MLSKKDKLEATTFDAWKVKDNGSDGIYISIETSEYYGQYIKVVYGPSEKREKVFISISEPEYLTFNKLNQLAKNALITAIDNNWEELRKQDNVLMKNMPSQAPDYSKLSIFPNY